jgi:hypothetical protein
MNNEMYAQRIENALAALAGDVRTITDGVRQMVAQNEQSMAAGREQYARVMAEYEKRRALEIERVTTPQPTPPTVDWVPIENAVFALKENTPVYVCLANGVIGGGKIDGTLDIEACINNEYMLYCRDKGYAETYGDTPPITHVAKVTLPRGPV